MTRLASNFSAAPRGDPITHNRCTALAPARELCPKTLLWHPLAWLLSGPLLWYRVLYCISALWCLVQYTYGKDRSPILSITTCWTPSTVILCLNNETHYCNERKPMAEGTRCIDTETTTSWPIHSLLRLNWLIVTLLNTYKASLMPWCGALLR